MKASSQSPVIQLMHTLTSDVVDIQKKMDAQFLAEADNFISDYANAPEEHKLLLLPSLPQRQIIAKHEVTARIAWRKEKTIGVRLGVGIYLVNLSVNLRFQRETSEDSSITIQIEQVPLPVNYPKP